MNTNRIAIIGISGSGKSVLGRELARKTGLPLFHMDQLFWRGNWQAVPEQEYLKDHSVLIEKEQWIIEGYVDPAMRDRLKRADLILYLDYSGILAAGRVIRRWFMHRKQSRPELPQEALEQLKREFLWRVFMRKERVVIEQALQGIEISKIVRFSSPTALGKYMQAFR